MPDAGETTGDPSPETDETPDTGSEATTEGPVDSQDGVPALRTPVPAVWSDEIDEEDEDDSDEDSDDGGDPDAGSAAAAGELEPAPVYELDAVLAGSEDRAREALLDITTADTIGDLVATLAQGEHVVSLQFTNLMRGYPGWLWTATLSRIDESGDVNVLEVELLPGEGSVLAPDWVPWSVRLADYRAAQDASGERDETEDDEYDDDTVVDGDAAEADEDEILDDDEADDDSDEDDSDDDDDDDSDDSDEDDSDDDDDSDEDDSDGQDSGAEDGSVASAAGRRGGSGRGRRRRRR
ncbi:MULTISPECIES: DUF3027 domain-containing protein [unclassified Rathayibacter]|uniref:DUF3027 domain-containing protein n=1 Tax=unclassified Rathayibacter TaxID=2609250 RepID=UPI001FB22931|nr:MULTISPECIES: DUF3027 domain-containing protein [unclassified Rathayibacter]MCJ1672582.1 DUF3027 domain-containing protein [Rathayibacter sp. VKM Ac-2929]MCJ1682060.1 DUF3027 domain-containing protein [Rathayibacter sp. VKM Ac-2928]